MAVIGNVNIKRLKIYEDSDNLLNFHFEGVNAKKYKVILKNILRKFNLIEGNSFSDSIYEVSIIYMVSSNIVCIEWSNFFWIHIKSENKYSNLLVKEISEYIEDKYYKSSDSKLS